MTHRAAAREPRPPLARPALLEEPNDVATYLTDASRFPGGRTGRVYLPRTEGEVAWVVRHEPQVLTVGARSSLTGGATPCGDAVLATERLDRIVSLGAERVRLEAGVPLVTLQEALAERGAFYPPAPTYNGALIGGTVSTNAAGAATWKYGTTRPWVEAITVVLASGHVLDLRRGEVLAGQAGFEVALPDGSLLAVPIPDYAMPDVPKRSAGYHAEPGMDLVDLFIGSEGTLGIITEVEVRILAEDPPVLVALVCLEEEARGLELVRRLREASQATWQGVDPHGLDVRAVESIDGRSIDLVRADGLDQQHAVDLPAGTGIALLIQLELSRDLDPDRELTAYAEEEQRDSPIRRLLLLLDELDAVDGAELALPGDPRQEQLLAVREAVPHAVNHRVRDAKRDIDAGIHKVAADMIVPFARFEEALAIYRRELGSRGLDHAIWGHISDGNVHANVIPRSLDDVEQGHEAILACGREVARLGGCPLSEHGTGRNPVKQELLRQLYGEEGLEAMRRTKRALDPDGKLARGVIFPWEA